jgi:hypothetical protein
VQVLFFFVLIWLFKPEFVIRFPRDFDPITLFLAVILGVSEMSAATLFGFSVMQAAWFFDEIKGRRSSDWGALARGGWVQMYFMTLEVLPLPLGAISIFLYISFEECIFRGVMIGSLGELGPLSAVALSTATFVLYQCFHTPGWRTAIFPMIGAGVVGSVHGVLYLVEPNIIALITAHYSYFVAIMWSVSSMKRTKMVDFSGLKTSSDGY